MSSINTRIVMKHDTSENWAKAVNFIPLAGELIVYQDYDSDNNPLAPKYKNGDGKTKVNDLPFAGGSSDEVTSPAIIDVVELPTENIEADKFYRVTEIIPYDPVYQGLSTASACINVNELPEAGQPFMDWETGQMVLYYETDSDAIYGYITEDLSSEMGVPVGWQSMEELALVMGAPYGGIVASVEEIQDDSAIYFFRRGALYQYTDAWARLENIGQRSIGNGAEIFNSLGNIASGDFAHAEGILTLAEGEAGHAEGRLSRASGSAAHAEGAAAYAFGAASHAEGFYTLAENAASHAEGRCTTASAVGAHAEGESSWAEGKNSHAEGIFSHALGSFSHAENQSTIAQGESSHAEGNYTLTIGIASHAEGTGSYVTRTISSTQESAVYVVNNLDQLGVGNIVQYNLRTSPDHSYKFSTAKIIQIDASSSTITLDSTLTEENVSDAAVDIYLSGSTLSRDCHAEGVGTIASGRAQHVQGEYNTQDPEYDENYPNWRGKYAHIVGNGNSHTDRSNAHTLDWSGNAWFQGDVYVGGSGQDDENAERLVRMSEIDFNVEVGIGDETVQQIPRSGKVTIADGETTPHFDFTGHDDANMAGRIEYGAVGNNSASFNGRSAALNKHAFAINNSTIAKGEESFAQGYETIAEGNSSVATGSRTWAKGLASHTEGEQTYTEGEGSHAEGALTKAIGRYSHAEGTTTTAEGEYSHAEGNNSVTIGPNSHAEGRMTVALSENAHSEGYNTQAQGAHSHAEGVDTITVGAGAHAEGGTSIANGEYSHAEGETARALSWASHAEGLRTLASNAAAHAEGADTQATAAAAHAEGGGTQATAQYSHAEGVNTLAQGDESHAEGMGAIAYAPASHAEGNNTRAIADHSHAEGNATEAEGVNSHAEGSQTAARAWASHAEGEATKALGNSSHAEGLRSEARGHCSHAGGENSIAEASHSFASGFNLTTAKTAQAVVGRGNVSDSDAMFVVGAADFDEEQWQMSNYRNSFTTGFDGNESYVTVGGVKLTESKLLYLISLDEKIGDIESALDAILKMQEELMPKKPTFTLQLSSGGTETCTFEEGMMWSDWCSSEYNTIGAQVENDTWIDLDGHYIRTADSFEVSAWDTITAGETYYA